MNILMIVRATFFSSPGGDTVQVNSTAKYLRLLGVQVDVLVTTEVINYSNYDLIHFFNIIRPDDILPHIFKSGLPYVVSTIFVDYGEYEKQNRTGLIGVLAGIVDSDRLEYIKTLARFVKNGDRIKSMYYLINGHARSIKYIAKNAAILLPNSHSEYKRFIISYGQGNRYIKVPNAIDVSTFDNSVLPNEAFRDHIICVGRIEGRKNQLNLLLALKETNYKVTIIGRPSPNHLSYYNRCLEIIESNENFKIVEHVDHVELSSIYQAARVHILPSWFETTGLSSLEAAYMDCNIVVTKKGDTEEYFNEMAHYCDPDNLESIRLAVDDAFNSAVNQELKKKIREEFIWEKAAEETLKAYKQTINTNQ